jgi:hypothetical protein
MFGCSSLYSLSKLILTVPGIDLILGEHGFAGVKVCFLPDNAGARYTDRKRGTG